MRSVVRLGQRRFELAGERSTTLTLAWLAAHRRLRALVLGGKRLTVLVLWDPAGDADAGYTAADEDAMYQLTYGEPAPAREEDGDAS